MTTDTVFPLTPMQAGMLLEHVHGRSGRNIEQIVFHLNEAFDHLAFRAAWDRVAARHASLRTSFRWEGVNSPVQQVSANVSIPVEVLRWESASDADRDARLTTFLRADRARGFDLKEAPLSRVTLAEVGENRWVGVWTVHHIVMDGRSFPVILREVFGAYTKLRDGSTPTWSAPPPSFADHAAWLSANPAPADAQAYWQRLLAGVTAPTPLGSGPVSAEASGVEGERREIPLRLEAETVVQLRQLGDAAGLSLSTVIQGAWAVTLAAHSGQDDVVFGAVRAGRRGPTDRVHQITGLLILSLPVRAQIAPVPVDEWLRGIRIQQKEMSRYERTPLVDIQRWSDLPPGAALFESMIVFDVESLDASLKWAGGEWMQRRFELHEHTPFPVTLYAYGEPNMEMKLAYDTDRVPDELASGMVDTLQAVLEAFAQDPHQLVTELPLVGRDELRRLTLEFNNTAVPYESNATVHSLFEAQVERTPNRPAVVCGGLELSYRELNGRANRLAHLLRERGIGPGSIVGLYLDRSVDLVVAVLAVHKAGGAYLPLDPAYPQERLAFMVEDSGTSLVISDRKLTELTSGERDVAVVLTTDASTWAHFGDGDLPPAATSSDLAYVIYTSGSTGKPKGVMVEHRNVVNFFAGMDEAVPHEPPGWMLALTSLSFDISVLELFWTLTRGFKVTVGQGTDLSPHRASSSQRADRKHLEFSLFYFAAAETGSDMYRLLLDGARFADSHGFHSVWTPERHFHEFGGIYPNPAVTGAAVAAVTERVQIRAGSCVLPLHHPARVAEEWAVVDNLSGGRVGLSAASGWRPEDFVLEPGAFADAKSVMFEHMQTVRKLWRGEAVAFPAPSGEQVPIKTLPRPIQAELPCWVTAAGSPETFRRAGAEGYNLLTHLLGQSVEELGEKIATYRAAWREAGQPGEGTVTVMLHTFVGDDEEEAWRSVRGPLREYLRSSLGLVRHDAAVFPTFRGANGRDSAVNLDEQPGEDLEALLDHAAERYFATSGLFGTRERALAMVERMAALDVDEVACLIDFGIDADRVLDGLNALDDVRTSWQTPADDENVADLLASGVTHFQCTPSMAAMLLADDATREALRNLDVLLVGGEALPVAIADALAEIVPLVVNMYGPTETTIWSTVHPIEKGVTRVAIGRPIANTTVYILDAWLRPVPRGVAGELYIGGDGVARGYHQRPELTRERFIPDPFRPGERIYRTGDLARYAADGTLEFLGRADFQVKVRGHRIELGEIETALARHDDIQQAVVTAREDVPGDVRLVAYLIATAPGEGLERSLRKHIAATLPGPMHPSHYVFVDAFPLTPNAKVDRKALPPPGGQVDASQSAAVEPHTDTERQLVALWCEVLNVDRVSVTEDFFALGGHSLIAMKIITRLREQFSVDVPLKMLFEAPTVAGMAALLDGMRIESADSTAVDAALDQLATLSDEEVNRLLAEPTVTREEVAS